MLTAHKSMPSERNSTVQDSNVFRIESIKCNRYLTLRILEITEDTPPVIVATARTVVIDMTEIIGIQCYEPITIEPCTTTT